MSDNQDLDNRGCTVLRKSEWVSHSETAECVYDCLFVAETDHLQYMTKLSLCI